MLGPDRSRAFQIPHALSGRVLGLGLVFLMLAMVSSTAHSQVRARALDLPLYQPELGQSAVPAYHPHKIILELDANTPRPGFGTLQRSDAARLRLA